MGGTLTSADRAVTAVLNRIRDDGRVAYLLGYGSSTFEHLTSAHAERTGEDVEAFRASFWAACRPERDAAPALLDALEAELADLNEDIRWAEDSDLDRLIKRRERMEAAIAKVRGTA